MFEELAAMTWNATDGVSSIHMVAVFAAIYIAFNVVYSIYDVYLGPLSKFPGPKLRAFSKFPAIRTLASGDEAVGYPALHAQYGPIVRVGPRELSFAGGARAWKDIYGFKKSGEKSNVKSTEFYGKPLNQVDNIITADDPNHSRQRKILSHSFADKTLKDLEPMLKQWVEKLKQKLTEKSGEEVDMLKYYNCTTFDIMGDLTFSEDLNMLENGEYSTWVKTIFKGIKESALIRAIKQTSAVSKWAANRFLTYNPKARVATAEHWNYSKERVDRRLARTPDRTDLWTKILEKSKGSEGLTLGEHHASASLFMLAGTETTATALSGTTYHLLRNPACLQKLTSEIRNMYTSLEDINLDSLQRLKYLPAVLQEGLRMYPPVPSKLPRIVPSDGAIIDGEWVPGGTSIGVHQLSTYRSASNFKNAYEFHPERWLHDPEYEDDHLDALEPFSVGPRNCIGKNLAWHEMRLILVTTLLYFDLQLSEESADWQDQRIYTIWEKRPLLVKVVARTS